jgi:hypothetical protein
MIPHLYILLYSPPVMVTMARWPDHLAKWGGPEPFLARLVLEPGRDHPQLSQEFLFPPNTGDCDLAVAFPYCCLPSVQILVDSDPTQDDLEGHLVIADFMLATS